MYTYIYGAIFILCVICTFFISSIEFKKIPCRQWTMIMLVPLACFGYFAASMASNLETALLAGSIAYIGATVLPTVFLISLFEALKYKIKPLLKNVLCIFSVLQLLSIWLVCLDMKLFPSPELSITKYGTLITWKAGVLSILHDIYICGIVIAIAAVLIKSLKNKQLFNTIDVHSYCVISIIMGIACIVNIIFRPDFRIITVSYLASMYLAAFSYNRNLIYDIESIVANKNEKNGVKNGYIMFDLNRHYLGATKKAVELVPDISEFAPKALLNADDNELSRLFFEQMDKLEIGKNDTGYIMRGNIACKYTISYFSLNRNGGTSGYIFELSDDTERHKYIEFMENYNTVLKEDVKNQTENISQIQKKVVLGLANMIENRDNNTGGHVKRTSDIVQILVTSMIENNTQNIEHTFAEDVIRAAPMHDLGKIVVDNSILCKPGKLTDDEYEIMKSHAAKSGEIVLNILEGVEKQHFVNVAFNVARYHHERWDGKGYPDNLKGEAIPLEARIMAIADVYDALVSKRVYKEPMSYDKAYDIMMENMGSQFDPSLAQVFTVCRQKLEAYYSQI